MLVAKRKSGIAQVGDLPWGSHFCLFHEPKSDRLEIIAPYFRAGLENNELALWVNFGARSIAEVRRSLEQAIPQLEQYAAKGQIELLSYKRLPPKGEELARAIVSALDRAMYAGFDGLRLACDALPEKGRGKSTTQYIMELTREHNVIAAFAYPRDRFDALGLMQVVKNHHFALIPNAGRWEVIESSEARTVKDELKRTEEKLDSLFSNMSEGFAYHRIVLDAAGKPVDYVFLEVNRAFERLTGLQANKVAGRPVTQILPGIESDPTDWIGKYGKVALTGEPAQFESYSETLGKWFSVSAFSTHRGYFAVTFSDITERKQAEEEIKASQAKLEAANKELESFAYSVSHDLRAPLRGIDSFSRILLEKHAARMEADARHCLHMIRDNAKQMGDLIDDLLAFSRLSQQPLKKEIVRQVDLVRTALKELKAEQDCRQIDLSIGELPEADADPHLLKQVWINLIGNALKYTRTRERAEIRIGSESRDGALVYYVKDNGVGFDMRYAHKLFGVFQRLHRSEDYEGTGVGLANVHRIITRHGGRVWAQAAKNHGATFYFTLGERVDRNR